MLFILTLFSMVSLAVYNKGISKPQGAQDSEWQKKGGDASMTATAPLSSKATPPGLGQPKPSDLKKEVTPRVPAVEGDLKLEK
ncbi:MAG: hypothetical protein J0L73_06690 [Verrucomicrobia bacterium]|nr:hypothetical protein [Verrucomicrobiota bacterium]